MFDWAMDHLPVKKWSAKDCRRAFIVPTSLDHKYSRGVIGMVTGSVQYPGAAVLSTHAALATGVGMVRFISLNESWNWQPLLFLDQLVLARSPEVVTHPGKVSAWLLGSGVPSKGMGGFTTRLRHRDFNKARRQSVPMVLDAGALYLAGTFNQPTLITPHVGELSDLLNSRGTSVTSSAIEGDPRKWAQMAAQILKVSVLLKGSITYLADEAQVIELPEATAWLATAGTGDVLAGVIGALVATNSVAITSGDISILEVGATGAMIHAEAAELSSAGGPLTAMRITDSIPFVVRKMLP